MSKWEKLSFEDVFDDYTRYGRKIMKEDYLECGKYPIVDQGQNRIAGYANDDSGIFEDVPAIIFGDHTRVIKYIEEPFFLGADGVKLLKTKKKESNYKYLFYFLLSAHIPNTGYNRHFKWLKELKIPLPPLEEQKRIADILDKASNLIDLRKQQLEKMDLLMKSKFIDMFGNPVKNSKGWEVACLGKLGELNRGISKFRPRNAPELLGGKYPLIQTGEVSNANLYIETFEKTYSELGLKQSKLWPKGTLCITIAANIAKTSILNFDACFPDSVVGFISNNQTNQIFIHYWFSFFQEILEKQAPESAQKNINLKILNELVVIVPPISLQNKFATFVEKVEKQKAVMQQSLEKMETNYKALMQEYFG